MKKIPNDVILSPRSVRERARPNAIHLLEDINKMLIAGQRVFRFRACPGLIPLVRTYIRAGGWRATATEDQTIVVRGPGEK